jgi:hypothetical protein
MMSVLALNPARSIIETTALIFGLGPLDKLGAAFGLQQ